METFGLPIYIETNANLNLINRKVKNEYYCFVLGAEKKLHKAVIRLKRHSFTKISLCGLFDLDGVLFLNFMGLITSYTIVLLQFAFL